MSISDTVRKMRAEPDTLTLGEIWQAADFIEHALSSPPNVGEGELVAALARLDEAREGWEAGERIDGDEAVCVLRLGTVRPIEQAARAYLSTPPHDRATIRREAFEEAAKVAEYFYDNSLKLMPSLQVKIATAIRALKETPDGP